VRQQDGDVCYRCGYALTSIADAHPCPECGLLARRSRRVTDELHYTRPRWLRRISLGTTLLLVAVLLTVASPVLAVVLSTLANAMLPIRAGRWLLPHVPLLGTHAAALCALAGAWLLASPEGYPPADRADRWRRVCLRLIAFAPLAEAVAKSIERHLIFNGGYWGVYDRPWSTINVTMLAAALVAIPLPLLLFATLRSLALRVRSAHLAEHCMIVGAGASAVKAYAVALVMLVQTEALGVDRNWISKSNPGMVLVLLMFLSALLFAIWSVYLLVRFAIAFRRTSRQMRCAWHDDDRAVAAAPAPAT
jgi:hypothetical protein